MGQGTVRNQLCHCGSGLKYKRCHLPLDQGFLPDGWMQWRPPTKAEVSASMKELLEQMKKQVDKVQKTKPKKNEKSKA